MVRVGSHVHARRKKKRKEKNRACLPRRPFPSAMSEHRSVRLGEWDCTCGCRCSACTLDRPSVRSPTASSDHRPRPLLRMTPTAAACCCCRCWLLAAVAVQSDPRSLAPRHWREWCISHPCTHPRHQSTRVPRGIHQVRTTSRQTTRRADRSDRARLPRLTHSHS